MSDDLEYKILKEKSGKSSSKEFVKDYLNPTPRMNYIFLGLFLVSLCTGLLSFPLSSFISGNLEEAVLEAGYPYAFLTFDLSGTNVDTNPLNAKYLIIDMILYLLIAYIVDILIIIFLKRSGKLLTFDKYTVDSYKISDLERVRARVIDSKIQN